MKTISLKSLTTKATVVATGIALLAGFSTLTQRAERSAELAVASVVTAPEKLYAAPAAPTIQLAPVIIYGKRRS